MVRAVRCVVCGVCGICGVRSTQKGTRKQHAKDPRKKHTQKAQSDLRKGGKMSRRASHAANLHHVDDERIRRDAYVSVHFHHPLIHGHHMYISQQSPKPAQRVNTRSSHVYIALKSKACTAHEHTVMIYGCDIHISQQRPKSTPHVDTMSSHAYIATKSKVCTAHATEHGDSSRSAALQNVLR